jgi:hypothetical protein
MLGGPLASGKTWRRGTREPGLDAELATMPLDLRVVFRGHAPVLHVPAGRNTPWEVAACRTPQSQCEAECPLFGRPVCAKYEVGIGWIR